MSRVLPSIALASLVVLSGCVFVETVQQPEAAIDFNGTINTTGEEIQIDGQIRDEFDFTAEHTYRDVVVCVYDGNETLLHKTPPRDMGPSSSRINVSITVDTVPEFVVVNSTDFWRDDRDVEVEYSVISAQNDGRRQLQGPDVEDPESLPVQGCTYPQGEEVSISFHGSVNKTDSGVEIDGELAAGGGIPEQES